MCSRQIPRSKQFRVLESELRRLRLMLPRKKHPTGDYSHAVHARTHGYYVLVHAEFEYYFEQRAKELARNAVVIWKTSNSTSKALASLLMFYSAGAKSLSSLIDTKQTKSYEESLSKLEFLTCLDEALSRFHSDIDKNHGIRERNLVSLLLPIGLEYQDFEPQWLAQIDAFGQSRGDVAHQSGSVNRVGNLPDPFDAIDIVSQLLEGAKLVDQLLSSLDR